MEVKSVYSIRLNKNDTLIKEYLKKYPLAAQNAIIKDLIICGIKTLQARQESVPDMRETNQKIEEILTLLKRSQPSLQAPLPMESPNNSEGEIINDTSKARKSISEALSMMINRE